jgi:hypothetical protein
MQRSHGGFVRRSKYSQDGELSAARRSSATGELLGRLPSKLIHSVAFSRNKPRSYRIYLIRNPDLYIRPVRQCPGKPGRFSKIPRSIMLNNARRIAP